MKEGCNLKTFLPTTNQIRRESIEPTWTLTSRFVQLRGGSGSNEFANGGAVQVELPSDRSNCQTLGAEDVDLRVATLIPAFDPSRRCTNRWRCSLLPC
jgi:hypothetical protein